MYQLRPDAFVLALLLFTSIASAQDAPKLSSVPKDAGAIAAARDAARHAREALPKDDVSAQVQFRGKLVPAIFYDYVECNAPNGLGCTGNAPMEVYSGYQACKPIFTVEIEQGPISANFAPDGWFTVDPLEAVSFKKYITTMTAHGGSHLKYTNVGIAMLPAEATSADRAANKCQFFPGPKF